MDFKSLPDVSTITFELLDEDKMEKCESLKRLAQPFPHLMHPGVDEESGHYIFLGGPEFLGLRRPTIRGKRLPSLLYVFQKSNGFHAATETERKSSSVVWEPPFCNLSDACEPKTGARLMLALIFW